MTFSITFPWLSITSLWLSIRSSWHSITLKGSPLLPITPHGASRHATLLSSLYFSCPAPLFFYEHAAPAQPTSQVLCVQTQVPGGLVGLPDHLLELCSWPLFRWLLPLIQACSRPWVSPPALTHFCRGIHAALCLFAPAPSTLVPCRSLYFRSHHPTVSHGQTQGMSAF